MDHTDYVELLRPAGLSPGGTWADLGAGSGAFSMALRELAGPQLELYAVDKDRARLAQLEHAYRRRFGEAELLHLFPADFSRLLPLPPLDGALMANSLHFFKDKEKVLRHVRTLLKPEGRLMLVEYNVDWGNLWVPYPLSFETFHLMAQRAGFAEPRLLARHPSSFLREFYSAVVERGGG